MLAWVWLAETEWSGRRRLAASSRVPDATRNRPAAPAALPDDNRLLALNAPVAAGNVFHATTIDRFIERREAQRKAEAEARRKAAEEAEARRKAAEEAERKAKAAAEKAKGNAAKAAPDEPPPKRIYALTFNGLITTPDRQQVGIVGIVLPGAPETRKSIAVAPGDPCLDAVVTELTRDAVTIRLKDGTPVTLEAGKTQRFEEPLIHGR